MTRHRRRVPRLAPAGLLAGALLAAAGCEIARPELPRFTTRITLPLGAERVTVAELAEDRDFLAVGPDSLLSLVIAGDPVSLSVAPDLAADLPGLSVAAALGEFAPATGDPAAFAFPLREAHPPAAALDGSTVPVPAFAFDLASDAADLPGVTAATVAAGRLEIEVTNGLPVPVSGPAPPDLVTVELVDAAGGAVVATVAFAAPVAAGATAAASADLAGAQLPDSVVVRLRGGSPGSATPVLVDADASLAVAARLRDLRVAAATAVIGAQEFTVTSQVALPDTVRLLVAQVVSGSLAIEVVNDLPLPVIATVVFPEVTGPDGAPLAATFDLPPRGAGARALPLAGATIRAPDGEPLAALSVTAAATSPGSAGAAVAVAAGDGLRATVAPATLGLGAVTGVIPRRDFVIAPVTAAVDLPDELDGIALTAATLTLAIESGVQVPARLDFTLTGRAADGDLAVMAGAAAIPAAPPAKTLLTEVVFDEGNSALVDLLNILPVDITLAGTVTVGGDGVIGTVRPGDTASVGWRVEAPLAVIVTGTTVATDPSPVNLDEDLRRELATRLGAARIVTEIANHLPLGVEIRLLAGTDPATLAQAPALTVGPFSARPGRAGATGAVIAATVTRSEAVLTAEQAQLLTRPDLCTLAEVTIASSGGATVLLRAADWVTVAACVEAELTVDE